MITFSREAYDDVVHEAYDGDEREACGVLAGDHGDAETTVTAAYPAANAADRPEIRYYIDPEEQLEIVEAIEDDGHEVAGFINVYVDGEEADSLDAGVDAGAQVRVISAASGGR